MKRKPKILIFGASGFMGSHLVSEFLKNKLEVIAFTRCKKKIKRKSKYLKVVEADLLKPHSYQEYLKEPCLIYYLVHGMSETDEFLKLEFEQAQTLSQLLTKEHKLIYLSALGSPISKHIKSRQNVGNILRESKAAIFELRASIILGKESLPFEMIYAIVRRFPFYLESSWSKSLCEPTALEDVVYALFHLSHLKPDIYEIGSGEKLTYGNLIGLVSEVLRKDMVSFYLPFLPKDLALKVFKIMLPEYFETGKHLLSSIEIETVVKKKNVLKLMKRKPMVLRKAIQKAISSKKLQENFTWADSSFELIRLLPKPIIKEIKRIISHAN